MRTRAILYRWVRIDPNAHMGIYEAVSVHKDFAAAHAQIVFLGGRLRDIAHYPDENTYDIRTVESFE